MEKAQNYFHGEKVTWKKFLIKFDLALECQIDKHHYYVESSEREG